MRLVKTYVLCVFGGREKPVSVAWVCNLSTVGQATPGIDGVYKDQSTSIKRSELHSDKGREMNNNNNNNLKKVIGEKKRRIFFFLCVRLEGEVGSYKKKLRGFLLYDAFAW